MINAERAPLVLIIDDDKAIRKLLSAGLAKSALTSVEAENGSIGLEQFLRHKPDVVLLDVGMPGMDGFAVCARIRSMPGGEMVPIIMVTGRDDYDSIKHAFEIGATDFVAKPINVVLISYRIKYVLRANKLYSDLQLARIKLASAQAVSESASWEWCLDDDRVLWGKDICLMAGVRPEAAPACFADFIALIPASEQQLVQRIIEESLSADNNFTLEHRLLISNDREIYVRQEGAVIKNAVDMPTKVVFTCRNITRLRMTEKKIRLMAYYDHLTGLPNRILFSEHLGKALNKAERGAALLAVLHIDIYKFRLINSTFGRETGDIMLQEVARRVGACLRKADIAAALSLNDVTARFGADEFGVILEGLRNTTDAAIVARRIIKDIGRPIAHAGNEIFLDCRIGLSIFPEDSNNSTELMKCADTALSRAKELEKGSYQFYTADLNTRAFARFALETSLRKAVGRDEFFLLYQPQVNLKSGKLAGVEALIRWRHPELGVVSPMEFIPVAEDTGLIVPIGEWVLFTACQQCRKWQDAGNNINVAINLSAAQFRDASLFPLISRALRESGVDPRLIKFEITETMLMDNVEESIEHLVELERLGCHLSIDDFGTGYSSLSYLKRFPVHELKIDRSFVMDLLTSKDDALIVKAIVSLAHNLNLRVVAEGVEENGHLNYLYNLDCDVIQGYLVSRPIAAQDIEAFLGSWTISEIV